MRVEILLITMALPGTAAAKSALFTDPFGTTTGTLDLAEKDQKVDTFTAPFELMEPLDPEDRDQTGDTYGNGMPFELISPLGVITGTIGSDAVNTFTDPSGTTTGTVGDKAVDLYTDPHGVTTGTIGDTSLTCFTDPFGNTDCK